MFVNMCVGWGLCFVVIFGPTFELGVIGFSTLPANVGIAAIVTRESSVEFVAASEI